MDLASMIERENFFELFFPTIERYYKEVFGEDVRCSFAETPRSANLVSYPHLSAFTMRQISAKARDFYFREWNIRNEPFKSAAAKIFVLGMTCSRGLFAEHRLDFQPEGLLSEHLVIAPNNRSIRFFDHETGLVGCIIKQGFTDRYFSNQLRFRLEHPYPFIPPLTEWGSDWFREPIMYGHPLARVTDESQYERGLLDALGDISKIVRDSLKYSDCRTYVSSLCAALTAGIEKARGTKGILMADSAEKIVGDLVSVLNSGFPGVPIALSHGDLQTGNIWVERDGTTWIYDWETAGIRSVWYDTSTLLLSLRRAGGVERLWTSHACNETKGAILRNDARKDYSVGEMKQIAAIVLLEDILFYLEDMLELPKDYGGRIFDEYITRLSRLI